MTYSKKNLTRYEYSDFTVAEREQIRTCDLNAAIQNRQSHFERAIRFPFILTDYELKALSTMYSREVCLMAAPSRSLTLRKSSHPIPAAMLWKMTTDFYNEAIGANGDRRFIDIGGSVARVLGMPNAHGCLLSDNARDRFRYLSTIHSRERKFNINDLSANDIVVRDKMLKLQRDIFSDAASDASVSQSSSFCLNGAQNCTHKATFAVSIHSLYEVTPKIVYDCFDKHGLNTMLAGLYLMQELRFGPDYALARGYEDVFDFYDCNEFPPDNTKTILSFRDNSLAYVQSTDTWKDWFYITRINGDKFDILVEDYEQNGPEHRFRFTRVPKSAECLLPRVLQPELLREYIKFPDIHHYILNHMYSEQDELPHIIIPAEFHRKAMNQALKPTELSNSAVHTYLIGITNRIDINTQEVNKKFIIDPITLQRYAYSMLFVAAARRNLVSSDCKVIYEYIREHDPEITRFEHFTERIGKFINRFRMKKTPNMSHLANFEAIPFSIEIVQKTVDVSTTIEYDVWSLGECFNNYLGTGSLKAREQYFRNTLPSTNVVSITSKETIGPSHVDDTVSPVVTKQLNVAYNAKAVFHPPAEVIPDNFPLRRTTTQTSLSGTVAHAQNIGLSTLVPARPVVTNTKSVCGAADTTDPTVVSTKITAVVKDNSSTIALLNQPDKSAKLPDRITNMEPIELARQIKLLVSKRIRDRPNRVDKISTMISQLPIWMQREILDKPRNFDFIFGECVVRLNKDEITRGVTAMASDPAPDLVKDFSIPFEKPKVKKTPEVVAPTVDVVNNAYLAPSLMSTLVVTPPQPRPVVVSTVNNGKCVSCTKDVFIACENCGAFVCQDHASHCTTTPPKPTYASVTAGPQVADAPRADYIPRVRKEPAFNFRRQVINRCKHTPRVDFQIAQPLYTENLPISYDKNLYDLGDIKYNVIYQTLPSTIYAGPARSAAKLEQIIKAFEIKIPAETFVADIGCGPGFGANTFTKYFNVKVDGYEHDSVKLTKANALNYANVYKYDYNGRAAQFRDYSFVYMDIQADVPLANPDRLCQIMTSMSIGSQILVKLASLPADDYQRQRNLASIITHAFDHFEAVNVVKPPASPELSPEFYLMCQNRITPRQACTTCIIQSRDDIWQLENRRLNAVRDCLFTEPADVYEKKSGDLKVVEKTIRFTDAEIFAYLSDLQTTKLSDKINRQLAVVVNELRTGTTVHHVEPKVRIQHVSGIFGCGKTTFYKQRFTNSDAIVTPTTTLRDDLRKELKTKNVYTEHEFFTCPFIIRHLYIDEAYTFYPGKIAVFNAFADPSELYLVGDPNQIPSIDFSSQHLYTSSRTLKDILPECINNVTHTAPHDVTRLMRKCGYPNATTTSKVPRSIITHSCTLDQARKIADRYKWPVISYNQTATNAFGEGAKTVHEAVGMRHRNVILYVDPHAVDTGFTRSFGHVRVAMTRHTENLLIIGDATGLFRTAFLQGSPFDNNNALFDQHRSDVDVEIDAAMRPSVFVDTGELKYSSCDVETAATILDSMINTSLASNDCFGSIQQVINNNKGGRPVCA